MVADLLQGLVVSVEIFVFTLLISLPLGIPLALARMSKNRVVSGTVAVWISIVRGTPLMLQIIFVSGKSEDIVEEVLCGTGLRDFL